MEFHNAQHDSCSCIELCRRGVGIRRRQRCTNYQHQTKHRASGIQKVQEFGIYIGPRYGYRGYRDYDYGYGYGYGYNPDYYYGPRRYYYGDGYRYRSERRTFRHLQRQAP